MPRRDGGYGTLAEEPRTALNVTVELNYERTALAPMMPNDHDDGFLTRLKIGF